jgi:hypothetical protein
LLCAVLQIRGDIMRQAMIDGLLDEVRRQQGSRWLPNAQIDEVGAKFNLNRLHDVQPSALLSPLRNCISDGAQ